MKIVTTVDFSTSSETILKITKTYAKKMEAEVFLIHTEPPNTTPEERDLTPEVIRLKKDAEALHRAGVKVTPVLIEGSACEAILEKAVELKADLIIAGAHGHGGPNCKVLGHIVECILVKSSIPVMIVPA